MSIVTGGMGGGNLAVYGFGNLEAVEARDQGGTHGKSKLKIKPPRTRRDLEELRKRREEEERKQAKESKFPDGNLLFKRTKPEKTQEAIEEIVIEAKRRIEESEIDSHDVDSQIKAAMPAVDVGIKEHGEELSRELGVAKEELDMFLVFMILSEL